MNSARIWCVVAAIGFYGTNSAAQTPSLVAGSELRVCADPGNLPFSNDKREGFENKIAALIGQDLELPVTYDWFPQAVGFTRNTLAKGRCDLVTGAISGDEGMEDTNTYYHSGFMLVSRSDAGFSTHQIGAPELADKQFGLIAGTPPSNILVRHELMDRTKTYSLVVDTRIDTPAREMLQDIIDKKIDVGLLWGPFAGYYIKRDHLPLKAVFIEPEGSARLDFRVTMGVRLGEADWRRHINTILTHHQDDIRHILDDFGIPLLDDQNKPLNPTPSVE